MDCLRMREISSEEVESYVRLPVLLFGKGEKFIVTADGSGMEKFGIIDGDMLLFTRDIEPKDGDVVAFRDEQDVLTARKLRIDPDTGKYRLLSGRDAEEKTCSMEDVYGVLDRIIRKYVPTDT